jgi:hypothetical protein
MSEHLNRLFLNDRNMAHLGLVFGMYSVRVPVRTLKASVVFLVSPGKFRGNTSTAFFQILSNSPFINYPTIRRYTVRITDSVVKRIINICLDWKRTSNSGSLCVNSYILVYEARHSSWNLPSFIRKVTLPCTLKAERSSETSAAF